MTTLEHSSKKGFFVWFQKKPADSLNEALAASRLGALKQNIKDALRYLRKKHLKSLFYRQKLPWYLVFGAANAGKTTLLSTSKLDLISTNQRPVEQVLSTSYCQWFFGKRAVFIDTAGSLMLPDRIDTAALNLWNRFLQLLYRYRHYHPLDGAILCIDLLDFQEKPFELRRQHIDVLLHHVQSFPYPIPIYILFTRCDRIQGFTEFFHTLNTEERDQICGVTLPPLEQQDFAPYLDQQFHHFLTRLNQQIISCLQRERDLQKRAQIKNFPLQLEAQKRMIVQLNTQLHSTKNPICGIYFTSSQQEGMQYDFLSPLLDTFGFPTPPNTSDRPLEKNTFFIKNTLEKITQHKNDTLVTHSNFLEKLKKPINSPKFYLTTTLLFFILMGLTLSSYFYNRQALDKVQLALTEYQNQQQGNTSTDSFRLLNTLKKGEDAVKYASSPLTGLVFHQARDLKKQLGAFYQQTLTSTFIPLVENNLEKQLKTDIEKKSPHLLDTLRVYLMMNDAARRDIGFMDSWFTTHLETIAPNQPALLEKNAFIEHLHTWLAQKSPAFKKNTRLIEVARDTLQEISPKELVYAYLEKKYHASEKALQNTLYATNNFKTIYEKDIPALSEQTLKNDAWLLGDNMPTSMMLPLVSPLTYEVKQLYTKRYIEFWIKQLAKLTIPNFENLDEARMFASTINTSESLLLEPIKIIQKNMEPVLQVGEGEKVTAQLEKLQTLLITYQKDERISDATKKLVVYLDEILEAKDKSSAIFTATEQRMKAHDKDAITQLINAAKEAPAPLDRWLTQVALNAWKTMLNTSQKHLNTIWQASVMPKYQSAILNRYPVFQDTKNKEITLEAFADFFGTDGEMENFFKNYLAAFVDSSTLYWQWKNVDGLHMNIPQDTLEMFNRASLIRKMYFAKNEKVPTVRFSLTPVNLELISHGFILALGNQSISYNTDFRQPKYITWPNKKSDTVTLTKEAFGNKQTFYEETGQWALFKLLAHADLVASQNPKLYQLTFNLEGQQVKYDLLADSPMNAFIPGILSKFRCPESL